MAETIKLVIKRHHTMLQQNTKAKWIDAQEELQKELIDIWTKAPIPVISVQGISKKIDTCLRKRNNILGAGWWPPGGWPWP